MALALNSLPFILGLGEGDRPLKSIQVWQMISRLKYGLIQGESDHFLLEFDEQSFHLWYHLFTHIHAW